MYCILVTGIPAAGKSVLAKRLSADMGLPWFSKDSIKEKLYDTLGFASREEKVRLGIASTEVLYYLAEQMMQCGKPFILENNFEASSRQGLVQRDKSSERHPGHVTNSRYFKGEGAAESQTITLEQYIAGIQSREMDSFSVGGPVITVDTTDFSKVDWEKLYQEIEKDLSV